MNIKLLTEHHLEFLSLKGAAPQGPESCFVLVLGAFLYIYCQYIYIYIYIPQWAPITLKNYDTGPCGLHRLI